MTDAPAPTEAPVGAGLRGQALAVVAALAAIIVIVVVTLAFSTSNTPMSVDGDRATYSSDLEEQPER